MTAPQLPLDFTAAERDRILDAVEYAAGASFATLAADFAMAFLRRKGTASGEQITDAAKAAGIAPPTNDRAFGPVLMKLSRAGLIEKAGFVPRAKGHGSGASWLWRPTNAGMSPATLGPREDWPSAKMARAEGGSSEVRR